MVSVRKGTGHLPAERIDAGRTLASTAVGVAPHVEEAFRWLPDGIEPAGGLPAAPEVSTRDARVQSPRPRRARASGGHPRAQADVLTRPAQRSGDVARAGQGGQ